MRPRSSSATCSALYSALLIGTLEPPSLGPSLIGIRNQLPTVFADLIEEHAKRGSLFFATQLSIQLIDAGAGIRIYAIFRTRQTCLACPPNHLWNRGITDDEASVLPRLPGFRCLGHCVVGVKKRLSGDRSQAQGRDHEQQNQ